jgi:hypothetical protein
MALADSYAALKRHDYLTGEGSSLWYREKLLKALTEALAQPIKPLAQRVSDLVDRMGGIEYLESRSAQPVQEPLTDDQIQEIYRRTYNMGHHGRDFENLFARGIERAHHIGCDK